MSNWSNVTFEWYGRHADFSKKFPVQTNKETETKNKQTKRKNKEVTLENDKHLNLLKYCIFQSRLLKMAATYKKALNIKYLCNHVGVASKIKQAVTT